MDTTVSSQNPDALKVIIFRAAEAIVSELGASQLTFASLSERSKIEEATLQQMFPDRDALLQRLAKKS